MVRRLSLATAAERAGHAVRPRRAAARRVRLRRSATPVIYARIRQLTPTFGALFLVVVNHYLCVALREYGGRIRRKGLVVDGILFLIFGKYSLKGFKGYIVFHI